MNNCSFQSASTLLSYKSSALLMATHATGLYMTLHFHHHRESFNNYTYCLLIVRLTAYRTIFERFLGTTLRGIK